MENQPRPAILDAIVKRASPHSYIRFNENWRPGDEGDKYRVPKRPDGSPCPLTDDVLDAHWRGDISIGFHLMAPGTDETALGDIDLDNHGNRVTSAEFDAEFVALVQEAANQELNLVPIRTSDHGYHLLAVYPEAVEAKDVRRQLKAVCDAAGVDCEVFPKQDSVPEGGFGNAVSLVGGRDSCLLDAELQPIPRENWQSYPLLLCPMPAPAAEVRAERAAVNSGVIERIEAGGIAEGNRTNNLKTLLVRLRKQNGYDETLLRIFARGYAAEFGLDEKDWTRLVKFAAGLPVDDIECFGQLVKIVPKYRTLISGASYRLEYRGRWVRIEGNAIRSATKVQDACLDQLDLLPDINAGGWRRLLPQLLDRMVVHETEGESTEDTIFELLVTYLASKFEAENKKLFTIRKALLEGYAVVENNRIFFKPLPVVNWINRTKTQKVKSTDILEVLRSRGVGDSGELSIGSKKEWVYWIDFEAVDMATDIHWVLDQRDDVSLTAERNVGLPLRAPDEPSF